MNEAMSLEQRTAWLFVLVVATGLLGCGDSGSMSEPTPVATTTVAPAASVGAPDPALVGTWTGQIEASSGNTSASGAFTMILNGDGSMTASSTNPTFRPVTGNWGVSQNQFMAQTTDSNGTAVNFTAPRSTTALTGTFSTGSGAGGTFTVMK